ncbi:hypothetical protein [Planktothricoides raciborskii]|uniref:Uncharacterized protein n=2 Tax=Planktothricoides raciborskii TaxID=132608 RepID=A0AAU8JJR5_9CYAN|nr:hypothetical protein [Planktothricoides raciborskii]MBD2545229.1 hypothetical protein [Planktothricoides raciborskii FACHB-1370]MBD2584452.1 hypothetical protein [Planktothricoides raciborskii FACHB-1261]
MIKKELIANQETGFLIFSAQIFGGFREETRFLMPQDAIAPPNFHNQTRNRVSHVCCPNFWRIQRRNPVSHTLRCDRPTKKPGF